jgi:hypothetical protein
VDASLTLACGLAVEERAARKGGARAVRVGLAARTGSLPEGPIASFGLAGALVYGLEPGLLLCATRVVDEEGRLLWEGEALPVPGAARGVLCAVTRVVDAAAERQALVQRTGAIAADMETGALAATGRLAGVVRAISDRPERPVGRLAKASAPDGSTAWWAVLVAFLTEPWRAFRTALDARRALAALERAAAALGGGGAS